MNYIEKIIFYDQISITFTEFQKIQLKLDLSRRENIRSEFVLYFQLNSKTIMIFFEILAQVNLIA